MQCVKCKKIMTKVKEISFNEHKIPGWKCDCGEIYFEPEQAQKIFLLKKLKKEKIKAKLGRIRSNLILRLPKDIETVLDLEKGDDVFLKVEDKNIIIVST